MSSVTLPRPATSAAAVLDHIRPGADLIVEVANGEPVTVLDAIEAAAGQLERVSVHQALPVHDRPYHAGAFGDRLRHFSYFLTPRLREHFERGTVDLVPNDLSSIPAIMRARTKDPLLLLSVSPPDRHGYVSLGTTACYGAALMEDVRVFVEVNPRTPRTSGRNQLHLSQVVGWVEADYPLWSPPPVQITDTDRAIASLVAERIPDGATLQIGIGAVPDAVAGLLVTRKDLGIHTEFFADGLRLLVESGAATGARKRLQRGQAVTTSSFGSPEIYQFLDENRHVEFWPGNETNDGRVIATHPNFCAVNATMQVDLLGQCASESLGSHYISSTGGQADFMRGAVLSEGGQSFIVTHATAVNGTISRIQPTLTPGAVVTTHKNLVDKVVTEHGVAELHGRSIRQRAQALIAIAAPLFRDELKSAARRLGYL
ncbi:MAG TPA: acetyl-CoA hydrolase/transferase C-terminal domain-containing protein [Candidatus Methylomirabilis sp.]|nr:acetyl-CoA hydrolase/transferase C-terminal domain-containing protein [Candidatus Methylomirabilis sp.]